MFSWIKRRRRQRILAEPFPERWLAYLRANVVQYRLLSRPEQAKLRERVQVFVAEKTWIGCAGLTVDDEMKVTIAVQACLLVLGIEYEYHYDQILSVLVYPDTYFHPRKMEDGLDRDARAVYGESWHRGPIVLSWKNTRRIPDEVGGNLVFHEFAHHLDDLDGGMDGTPPLERGQHQRWDRVVDDEYHRLVRASRQGQATLLNHYGASNRAEFFAVATECFFERPVALRELHAELYAILRDFYRQDPAQWAWNTIEGREEEDHTESEESHRPSRPDLVHVGPAEGRRPRRGDADAFFSEGIWLMSEQRFAEAVSAFDKAIELAPDDAEAVTQRASAHLRAGDIKRAIEDATAAIELDVDDAAAWRVRAEGYLGLAQYDRALVDCERALKLDDRNGQAYRLRGLARAGLGELHRAVRDYGTAIHFNADMAETLRARADVWERLGQPDKAQADRAKAQRLDKGHMDR
ncbi:MAG TPA: zinc-dependent peptidase [Pirellulales bacterium]|nr:zinc-dependent peptidase [Pirellulales bacterium]